MSQTPTDSFLQNLVAGTQMMGQAGQNVLGQQQLGLQQAELAQRGRGMMQEERMQQRQLAAQQQMQLQEQQAQQQSYAQLNASRERMQTQEIEAGRLRQQEQQAFMQQQNQAEQRMMLERDRLMAERERIEAEFAAAGDKDVQGLRQRRADNRQRLANINSAMAAADASSKLATGVREDRLQEVEGRLTQFQEAVGMRNSRARDAIRAGFDYAGTLDALNQGFVSEAARLAAERGLPEGTALDRTSTTVAGAGVSILLDNVQSYFTGYPNKEMAFQKATEFLKNGSAMAAQTLYNALELNGNAFGLEPGKKQEAAAVVAQIAADAAILAGTDRMVSTGGAEAQAMRQQKIAQNVQKLRDLGMGDEQIAGMFDGLESMSTNRAELMTQLAPSGGDALQAQMLDKAFKGVGDIADVIQGVISNGKLMNGRAVEDLDKFDWAGVMTKAQAAYGMGQSGELAQLMSDMKSLGMTDQELMTLSERLIAADPRLSSLRPEDFVAALQGMSQQATQLGLEEQNLAEEERVRTAQTVQQGKALGAASTEQALANLIGTIR